jgi:O-antigen/teichoic acid export membrane protein
MLRLDPISRGWAVVTSAGVLRLGLGLIASLVIARALGPAGFGVYAVLGATVGVAGTLAEGGLTEAAVLRISAVRRGMPESAEQRAAAFFWLRIVVSTAVVTVGCALAGLVAQFFLNGIDDGLLRLALLGIIATAASGAVSAVLQASGAFGRMSSLTLINTGLTAALATALAAIGRLEIVSALVILGIGTSLATFAAGKAMLGSGWRLTLPTMHHLEHEARQLIRTGRWLWLASLFAMVTANAEVLLLNRSAGLSLVGSYALALNLASKADLVNQSLYTVLLPSLGGLDVRARLASYARRGLIRSAVIALGLLLLIPVAEPLVVLVYGAEFAQAAVFLRLLLGIVILDVLLTPFLLLPLAYRRPKLLAAADGVRAVTLVVVAVALLPVYGAYGAIVARLFARIGGAVVVLGGLYSGRQSLEIKDKEPAGVAE